MTDQAMESNCEHAYATHVRGGEPVSVRVCTLCGQPDWPDLREQVNRLCDAAAMARQHEVALAFRGDYVPSAKERQRALDDFARDYPGVDPNLPAISARDVEIVADALRDQYGSSLRWPLSELAEGVVRQLADAGRLGRGPTRLESWEPSPDDIDAFQPRNGMMRLWRAEEIAGCALTALRRAGRLLDRETA